MKRLAAAIAMLCSVATFTAPARAQAPADAQNYPNQMVKIIVAISPGSAADLLARAAAEKLSQRWKQQVIVENRPGVAGIAAAAKSPADGYTLYLSANGHVVLGETNQNLPFDPIKDFTGVAQITTLPFVFISSPTLSAKNLKEFIADAKQRPGVMNYASAGYGSTAYLAAVLFTQAAGVNMTHVAYRGGPEAVMSVIRGDAQMYFATAYAAAELLDSGQVRGLAVTGPSRVPLVPKVPTFAEAGLPEFSYDTWFGVWAPAGTPDPIVQKVSRDLIAVMSEPEMKERLSKQGMVIATKPAKEFNEMVKADSARFISALRAVEKK
ncbi:MAG: hypothetical protein J0H62_11815 [Rhizobiales bacterium]|nr:hypothetical protein [Hyphomicrobiales bacterium]